METNGKRIRSLDTTVSILEAMESGDPVSVTAVAEEVGTTKATVHNHLSTLVANDLVVKEGTQYRLGLRFSEIGDRVCASYRRDPIRQTLDQLASETDALAHFVVPQHRYAFLIHTRGEIQGLVDAPVRVQSHLHETAPGRTILAAYSGDQIDAYADAHDAPSVERDVARIRDRGYAVGKSMRTSAQLRSIATVVRADDDVLGSVSLAVDPDAIKQETFDSVFTNRVRKAANAIEVNLRLAD